MNLIEKSKEKSVKISVENYLRAVDVSIMNKDMNSGARVLDGWYSIIDNGKVLKYQGESDLNNTINVEFNGQGLVDGEIEIKSNKVVSLSTIVDRWTIIKTNGGKLDFYKTDKIEKSILVVGFKFNVVLKNLVNKTTDMKYDAEDNSIKSIEFYSKGLLPSGYTKESLSLLPQVSVSEKNDIMAYNDNGKVYIISDNLINFNEDSSYMFYRFRAVTQIQFRNINTSDVTNMNDMFAGCIKLINLDLNKFDTTKVTTMENLFLNCSSLINLNLKSFDISNVVWARSMFQNCSSIETLDLSSFKTNKIFYTSNMFNCCTKLKNLNLSNFDTSKVTDMSYMFISCSSLTGLDLSSFNTSKVTSMGYMFYGCTNLISLDLTNFNTSSLTNMGNMFSECRSLTDINLSSFDTSNVTGMVSLFLNCNELTTLDLSSFNTVNVKNMNGMFSGCNSLTSLDLSSFDTSNVSDMSFMFYDCYNLSSLNLSSFNTENVKNMYYMFTFTSKLETLVIGCDWKTVGNINDIFYLSKYNAEKFNVLVEQTQATCATS